MKEFVKPTVVVSKCLGFAHCRYNGLIISDEFVDKLKNHVKFLPVCPELEIGLGVPRDPVRIVMVKGDIRLLQPTTRKDVTNEMNHFNSDYLNSIDEVDGFILKSRSPSCGIKDVKLYSSTEKGAVLKKNSGFFGGAVIKKFSNLAIEDEGRLRNYTIREHFLKKLFTLARFREVKKIQSMTEIVKFHTENKLLFMAYNQKELRIMGRIVANREKHPIKELLNNYEAHLFNALAKIPRYTSNINVMMHALGHFSKNLTRDEKAFFLDMLEKYRTKKSTLSSDISILQSWLVRFKEKYLIDQTYLNPFPEDLIDITDSGKGRDYS